MAKVKYGAMINDARGKMDGVVYSKNANGAYVRTKVSPVQPQTVRQSLVRARLATLSKTFSTVISAAQQLAWNAFGKLNPVVDQFGDSQTLSGLAAFVRLNAAIINAGEAQISNPPANLEVIGLLSLSAQALKAGDVAAATGGSLTANVLTLAFAANPFVVGQSVDFSGFAAGGIDLNGTSMVISTRTAIQITGAYVHADIVATGAGSVTSQAFLGLTFTSTPIGANKKLYIFATPGMNPGVQFFKPAMRFLGVSAANQASLFDAGALYAARFGSMTATKVMGVMVSTIDYSKGALTPGVFVRVIIA